MDNDEFLTLNAASEGYYTELRSKFFAFASPVSSADEAMEILASLRKKYHDARHIAYSYVIGADRQNYRINDDGEPSGTAGRPIYGAINKSGLTNVIVCVVRYFGGIKLGTSRLAKAYRAAAEDALSPDKANYVNDFPTERLSLRFPLQFMGMVMNEIKGLHADVLESKYSGTDCIIIISIRSSLRDTLVKKVVPYNGEIL